jgi:hypothetical protein
MNNSRLLQKKLGDKTLAQLDEEDILHPEETLRSYRLGIDLDYLVRRVGQGSEFSH